MKSIIIGRHILKRLCIRIFSRDDKKQSLSFKFLLDKPILISSLPHSTSGTTRTWFYVLVGKWASGQLDDYCRVQALTTPKSSSLRRNKKDGTLKKYGSGGYWASGYIYLSQREDFGLLLPCWTKGWVKDFISHCTLLFRLL